MSEANGGGAPAANSGTGQSSAAPAAGQGAPAAAAANQGGAAATVNESAKGGQAAPAATDWTSTYTEEARGFIQAKGWKDQNEVVNSYVNLEKFVGADPKSLLKVPGESADQKDWEPIYDRLGRPKTADGYKLEIPKENGSPEFAKAASETFHKLGLSEKQGQELVKWWNQNQETQIKSFGEQKTAQIETQRGALKKEWGAAHDQNINAAKRAVGEFVKLEPGKRDALIDAIESVIGFDGTMKFFHSLGSKIGEASFHSGSQNQSHNGPMTPEAANAEIKRLSADPDFTKKYLAGNAEARTRMQLLHEYKTAGQG